jgi:segregation and condensation protein B
MILPLEPRDEEDGREGAGEVGRLPAEAATEREMAEGDTPEGEIAEAPPEPDLVPIQPGQLRSAIEAVLFSVAEPVTIRALADLFGAPIHDVREAVEELRLVYIETGRAFRLEDIAGGIQVLTLGEYDPWVRRLREKARAGRLSAAALETLAVIAYKQPINKADLESVRGVNCGPTLKTLLDRGLIQVVGRGDALGRPLLYGTTKRFLESFGLASIRELPQPEVEQRIEERLQAERAGAAPAGSEDAGSEETAGDSAAVGARVGLEGEGLEEGDDDTIAGPDGGDGAGASESAGTENA